MINFASDFQGIYSHGQDTPPPMHTRPIAVRPFEHQWVNGLSGPRWFESAVQFTVVFFIREFYSAKNMSETGDLRWGEVKY